MAGYFDFYKSKLGDKSSSVRLVREKTYKDNINLNFCLADGYKQVRCWDRSHVDKGHIEPVDSEIIVRGGTNGYERFMTFRPDVQVDIGAYILYDDGRAYIIRELQTEHPTHTYRAFECNQTLRLYGCPVEFPCFSYNSTYSSKGIIDLDRAYGLDSRNKIYIQKNVFSNRLLEHHRGYRIRLGDEQGWYTFYITEMDDLSYKGMYIVSLKIDETNPLDGSLGDSYAFNENPIDFSDLIMMNPETGTPVEKPIASPVLYSDMYYNIGEEFEVVSNKSILKWTVNEESLTIVETLEKSIKLKAIKKGLANIQALDTDDRTVEKAIMIK